MRGESGRFLLRLAVYPLLMALLPVIASAAYLGPSTVSAAVVSSPARDRAPQPDPLGKAASREVITKPVPPVTTVLVPTALEQLHADLLKIGASNGGRVGISLQELSGPRRTAVSLGARQSFYAASAYKLPLLMAEAQQIATGHASPSDRLCYDPADQEDGWFTDYNPGTCFTRQELAQRAGIDSDNTAAHILVRYLGGPDALNAYARSAGMTASALWVPNTTTPDDLAAAWVNEALGRLGGVAAQRWLYPLLTHTASEQGIPAGVPGTVAVVHKVGTLSGSENDSAYVTGGRVTYVLSVAVDGTDEVTGWRTIAQISSRIWRYESSRPAYVVVASAGPSAPLWPDRRH
ncbi:MAG: serine hydrolase [Chloroflexi bacterium]|nr:MAG: serine hydrolase [Chloroflexota bacterium]